MKKIILLVLTTVIMAGCNQPRTIYTKEGVKIVDIDSCEYIKCSTYGFNSYVYSHKGNCKYCNERRKKELKKLVEQIKEK